MSDPLPAPPAATPGEARPRRRAAIAAAAAGGVVVLAVVATLWGLGDGTVVRPFVRVVGDVDTGGVEQAEVRRLEARIAALRPRGIYIVIDSQGNRLRVYDNDVVLREAVCSTGSGTVLIDPSGRRRWTFDTPLGERRVQRKVRNPVWSKPDWAFIEEGYQPPSDPSLRLDTVSLGDYALYLGDGYIIHGTLFQTLLGRGVTHGCVRLGDEDLEYVYRTVPVGARVLLY